MKNIRPHKSDTSNLRKKAENMAKKKTSKANPQSSDTNILRVVHELEVHQIELELQNEELLQTRAAAQVTAEKYTELFDFAPFGYFTLSPEGQILDLNLHGAQMLGKERSRLKNSTFTFFVSTDSRPVFNNFLERVFKDKLKQSCEIILETIGNPLIYVKVNGIMLETNGQCLINIIDVTESKQAEKAMVESQRLNAIGEMASSIAHDFNNSLQVITGNLELAMMSFEFPETTLQYLKTIRTTADDSAERVRLLQRFGEKKKDRSGYSYAVLNTLISEVITQVRPLWKDEAEKKGLSIAVKTLFGEIPEIFCDKGELRTVLYNIFKNSIEAMPDGGEIRVETGKRLQEIYVTIADTGNGMNEETKARIFQPFYSTKGFDIGRGLGMSGAHAIITEHGGNIYVKDTAPGKGTTIEITLPSLQKQEVPETIYTNKTSDFKGELKVLWVDDDIEITALITEMIKILGHKVDIANNGKKALEYLDKDTYDLLITDIGMPDMNGWQLANIIRGKFGNKLKIAVASGWGDQISEAEKDNHGVDFKINKPFSISQLSELFEEVLYANANI